METPEYTETPDTSPGEAAVSTTPGRPRVGVSACLAGEPVRWKGGDAESPFVTGELSRFVDLVALCPEVEIGLGVPREPIRLLMDGERLRLVEVRGGADHSARMEEYAGERARGLAEQGLDGFLLKSRSPSCGLEDAPRFRARGDDEEPVGAGAGAFASVLTEALPLLAVEDEIGLEDLRRLRRFAVRIFAAARVRLLLERGPRAGEVVAFHGRERLLILAHDPEACRALDGLAASSGESVGGGEVESGLVDEYRLGFLGALAAVATRVRHVSVLERMAGDLRRGLASAARRELEGEIDSFGEGTMPLATPLGTIRGHAVALDLRALTEQSYREPYPPALGSWGETGAEVRG
ncbi:MAG: DUF523 and DUF1722 domain-containing protein [Planctomycetota bacterium]